MIRWTEITSDSKQAEENLQTNRNEAERMRRKNRSGRVLKSVVIPGFAGLLLVTVGFATLNFGYTKIDEHLEVRKVEKSKQVKAENGVNKLEVLKKKINDTEKSAKEILFKAYNKEEKTEAETLAKAKVKLKKVENSQPTPKKPSLPKLVAQLENIQKELLIAIQRKEFVNDDVPRAVEEKEKWNREVLVATRERRLQEQKSVSVSKEKELLDNEAAKIAEENEKAQIAIEAMLSQREKLEQDSLLLAEMAESIEKEKLLEAIGKIEMADKDLQTAAEKLDILKSKLENTARNQEEADKKLHLLLSNIGLAKEKEQEAINQRQLAEENLMAAGNRKDMVEKEIEAKTLARKKEEMRIIEELEQHGWRDLIQEIEKKVHSYSEATGGILENLREDEGKFWLRRAQKLLSAKDYFSGNLMLARVLGFQGDGILSTRQSTNFQVQYRALFQDGSESHTQARDFLLNGAKFYPIWNTHVQDSNRVSIKVRFSPDGRVLAIGESDKLILRNLGVGSKDSVVLEHSGLINFSLSSDGKIVASLGQDSQYKTLGNGRTTVSCEK